MKAANWFLIAHVAATVFAIAGLTIALPNPSLWAGEAWAGSVFNFGMMHGGAVHMVAGTAAVFCYGVAVLGWGRTLTFFLISTTLSLTIELIGTATGWPFGAYEYTSGLGYKILGDVPFSVPLSWFYMGLSCYLIARFLVERATGAGREILAVLLGAWLLTSWDLVLDPAMAYADLPVKFWVWHETGPYMGMPLSNFVGWFATGALFMALGRLSWRGAPAAHSLKPMFPFLVYAINLVFAGVLAASNGLWIPVLLAVTLGFLPTLLIWRPASSVQAAAT